MALDFVPPGPGQWALDRSHYPGGTTPLSQWLLVDGMQTGFRRVFAELGLPAETMSAAFVHGFLYTRLRPLIGADSKPTKPPPTPVLKIVTRIHPAFRARNKMAVATLRDRPSNAVVKRWQEQLRPRLVASNRAFQDFDERAANDVELQAHVSALLDQLRNNVELHFWLHGHDLGPIARYLHVCLGWGLDPTTAISALAGSSPVTIGPMDQLSDMRKMLEQSPAPVTTLADFRAISDDAAALLDAYLDERGHILATGYDLDARTLIEMPDTVLGSIRSARSAPRQTADDTAGHLRNQLAPANRATFDERLADARNVMDMRDDNGPLTIEWPMGLLRRALTEAGRRLVERDQLYSAEHLLEVTHDETHTLFDGSLPSADDFAARANNRSKLAELDPPLLLGPTEPEPPLRALPPALAELTSMVKVAVKHMGMSGGVGVERFAGVGIGDGRYVGVARVAMSADDAFDRLNPGEVLIVRATSPAFNVILSIAGAVVTSDGGVLSHAAVLTRELGIPAVIGVPGALTITDGSTVEVDATAGVIRVIAANSSNVP